MNIHPFRVTPFVFGVLFLLVAAGWTALEYDVMTGAQLRLAGPIALIVIGLIGVALTFRRRT
ncbi:hypothetical protein JL108_01730 [Aeromicrobium sp. YIM 150415]|uniref:Uncharacterized protein n=1 Tax=Aeromicrobium piscarium TaxID=2590901 RepID=A0A554SPY9_9ACTN|nr:MULTISPECIES: hypothetical protein [Aeromicrobium]MBM9462148.1 hypothetical protein [Aeromicrobium sp. YIM 150415]TSD68388.1 hypothetical protein FNM00_02010 [Aeromicrobium piscarium]